MYGKSSAKTQLNKNSSNCQHVTLCYRLDIIESAHRSDIHSGIQPFPYDPYNQGHSGDHTR